MRRLTEYLTRQFLRDALILFAIVAGLLWMVQCLRIFDVVSVKGQSLLTLAYQGLLTMPPLVLTFAFVCFGIGLARALASLSESHQLHIIHVSGGIWSALRATLVVAGVGTIATLILANVVGPAAQRELVVLNAEITADLVSSTLRPGRFMQVTPGVVLFIGNRSGAGRIGDFFADDRRDPQVRRTYIAQTGTVAQTSDGYVVQLVNGAIQSREENGRFAEVRFEHYDLNVARFAEAQVFGDWRAVTGTGELIQRAIAEGGADEITVRTIVQRLSDGFKVLGMCLLVYGLAGFPSARRHHRGVPMEVVVLFIAFAELAISSYGLFGPLLGPASGTIIMTLGGAGLIGWKLRPRLARLPA